MRRARHSTSGASTRGQARPQQPTYRRGVWRRFAGRARWLTPLARSTGDFGRSAPFRGPSAVVAPSMLCSRWTSIASGTSTLVSRRGHRSAIEFADSSTAIPCTRRRAADVCSWSGGQPSTHLRGARPRWSREPDARARAAGGQRSSGSASRRSASEPRRRSSRRWFRRRGEQGLQNGGLACARATGARRWGDRTVQRHDDERRDRVREGIRERRIRKREHPCCIGPPPTC